MSKLPDHLAFLDGCKVKRVAVERLEVVGPMDRSKEFMAALHDRDYRITSSGPYSDRKMFPECDVTRFLYTAERPIEP